MCWSEMNIHISFLAVSGISYLTLNLYIPDIAEAAVERLMYPVSMRFYNTEKRILFHFTMYSGNRKFGNFPKLIIFIGVCIPTWKPIEDIFSLMRTCFPVVIFYGKKWKCHC